MANPIAFTGHTHDFGPPPGQEDRVGRLTVFSNGRCVVSAWRPTESELEKLNHGEAIFVSHVTGERSAGVDPETGQLIIMPVVYPTFVGCESECAAVVSDYGKVWTK